MRRSPSEVDEIVALYRASWTLRDLAKRFQADRRTLKRILRKRGIPIRTHTEARMLGAHAEPSRKRYDYSELVACYKAGATQTEMQEIFGIHPGTLGRVLERHGLRTRTVSEGKRAQLARVPVEIRKQRAVKMVAGLRAWLAAGNKRAPNGQAKPRGLDRRSQAQVPARTPS